MDHSKDTVRFSGYCYVRPVGRGIELLSPKDGWDMADIFEEDCYYKIEVAAERVKNEDHHKIN